MTPSSHPRVVVVGAGAIGGLVAASCHQAGVDTVLVARGAARVAIEAEGVVVVRGDESERVHVTVAPRIADVGFTGRELVVLAVKSQDTAVALDDLAAHAPGDVTVACAQNGVANEREALRRFADVLGVVVFCPSEHVRPGTVTASAGPLPGVLDVGQVGAGPPSSAARFADVMTAAGFAAQPRADVSAWKYRKLVANLANVVEALCGVGRSTGELSRRARDEGRACLSAAHIALPDESEYSARAGLVAFTPGRGGSTWQSRARGGSWETPYLNGEITLVGREHSVPVPVNELLVRTAAGVAATGTDSELLVESDLLALLPG